MFGPVWPSKVHKISFETSHKGKEVIKKQTPR